MTFDGGITIVVLFLIILPLGLIIYLEYREKEQKRLLKKYNNEQLCKKLLFKKKLELLYDKYKDLELAKTIKQYDIESLYDKYKDLQLAITLKHYGIESLYEKYKNIEICLNIKRGTIWIGMTKDMLIDSWGEPEDIKKDISTGKVKYDKNGQPNITATLLKVKETYKYGCVGTNRYKNHIYLLNDIVTGWKK